MQIFKIFLLSFFGVIFGFAPLEAKTPNVEVSATAQTQILEASKEYEIFVDIKIAPAWHIYYKTAPDTGLPTTLKLTPPQGFVSVSETWSTPQDFTENGVTYKGYKDSAQIKIKFKTPNNLSAAEYAFDLKLSWLECKDVCIPNEKILTLLMPAKISSANTEENLGFFALIGMAFLGGIILNLMPCVFPVLALKILSFTKNAGNSFKKSLTLAALYTLGIMLSFWLLAAILLVFKDAGQSLGWGFQLQNPIFVAGLALIFTAIALNLLGVFEVGVSISGKSSGVLLAQKRGVYFEALFSGVLAVIVASPCTAPFMGVAVGTALTGNTSFILTFAIFTALALGLAFPYILLSINPKLISKLPKPGRWMQTLKQALSIPIWLAVFWLVWIFFLQRNCEATLLLLFSAIILALALWIFGKFCSIYYEGKFKSLALILFFTLCASAFYVGYKAASSPIADILKADSEFSWSLQKQESLLAEGKTVFVDFTAAWCLTCQANKIALYSKDVEEVFKNKNIILLTADWTNKDDAIYNELQKFGRSGVPLYVIYSKNNPKGLLLPTILTKEIILEFIDK